MAAGVRVATGAAAGIGIAIAIAVGRAAVVETESAAGVSAGVMRRAIGIARRSASSAPAAPAPALSDEPSVGTVSGTLGEVGEFVKGAIERLEVGPFEMQESQDGANTVIEVKGAAAEVLAGGEARALDALQLLANQLLLRRDEDAAGRVVLDVEGGSDSRERHLERLAERVVKRAIEGGRAIALDPMNGRDRRTIHISVREYDGVATMSIGKAASVRSSSCRRALPSTRKRSARAKAPPSRGFGSTWNRSTWNCGQPSNRASRSWGRAPIPPSSIAGRSSRVLLERWSERINLTGHRGALAIAERLLLEAAALSQVLPAAESIVDLGSGAGIPGLPLAICRPGCTVRLVESRERRHHFQRAAIRDLGLDNAIALLGRAEELEVQPSEGVIAQAMAQPEQALQWMRPWMTADGWLALATVPGGADRLRPPRSQAGTGTSLCGAARTRARGLDRAAAQCGSGPVTIGKNCGSSGSRHSREIGAWNRASTCVIKGKRRIPQGDIRGRRLGLSGEG